MKLNQARFLWAMKNVHPEGETVQDETSVVRVDLRPQIQITHDYKKGNRIEVIFKDDGARFVVDDHNQLQDLIIIHLSNKDCVQKMRAHCEKIFKRVSE